MFVDPTSGGRGYDFASTGREVLPRIPAFYSSSSARPDCQCDDLWFHEIASNVKPQAFDRGFQLGPDWESHVRAQSTMLWLMKDPSSKTAYYASERDVVMLPSEMSGQSSPWTRLVYDAIQSLGLNSTFSRQAAVCPPCSPILSSVPLLLLQFQQRFHTPSTFSLLLAENLSQSQCTMSMAR